MSEVIELEFHSKELSDFQMGRLVKASLRKFSVPITGFISDATIAEDTCLQWQMRRAGLLVMRWRISMTCLSKLL